MSPSEMLDALNRVDALLSDESKWTKDVVARDAYGQSVEAEHPDATCWCFYGALLKVGLDCTLAHSVWHYCGPSEFVTIGRWNDSPQTTFADVKKLIADTRARLEAA